MCQSRFGQISGDKPKKRLRAGLDVGHHWDRTTDSVTVSRAAYELLKLKTRAMDTVKEGITIASCSMPEMPLIYANEAFARITGFSVKEALGKNCRFLQGKVRRLGNRMALSLATLRMR
jgi:PAS domain-containing protein